MVKTVFFIVYSTFVVLEVVKCETNCDNLGILLYEDLGCKPVKKSGQTCPESYNCDDFRKTKDSCLFKGRNYALNEQVDNSLTYGTCNVGCYCNNFSGGTKFTCAILDCPEWLGAPVKPGCYRKFELDKCCSAGMNCPSEDTTLGKCSVDGKTYREGEKFFVKNTCQKCICPKNFNGKLESPHCQRYSCNVQINHGEELSNNCAPCYVKSGQDETLCCPDTWVCPSTPEEIITVKDSERNSELKCKFGNNEIGLGGSFDRTISYFGRDRNVKCECIVPPLMTCKEK